MKIMNKRFKRVKAPRIFTVSRVLTYTFALIMILGLYGFVEDGNKGYIQFYIILVIAAIIATLEILNTMKKSRHMDNNYFTITKESLKVGNHLGEFDIKYEDMDSYLVTSDVFTISTNNVIFRFKIKEYDITVDETKKLIDYIISKDVDPRKSMRFMLMILLVILFLNFGVEYIIENLLGLTEIDSLFAMVYFFYIGVLGVYIYSVINLRKVRKRSGIYE